MQEPIKVVLYERNKNVRDLFTDLLSESERVQLSYAFEYTNNALAQIEWIQPDVVIIDTEIYDNNGLDVLQALKMTHPYVKIMILCNEKNKQHIFRALCCGAQGYVLKTDMIYQLECAIKAVYNGFGYLSAAIIPDVINLFTTNFESQLRLATAD
jgi:DNA-binding NarL/FixJ family response regulator